MEELLYRAYLENISETRRFLERQENRLYALLTEQRIIRTTQPTSPMRTPPLQRTNSLRRTLRPITPVDPLQSIISDLLRDIGSGMINDSELLDAVPITPTQEQIDRVVQHCQFCDIVNPISNICPIQQTEFEPTDDVMRITRCGHIFGADELTQWFARSPRCPVCRYDIRDVSNNDPDESNEGTVYERIRIEPYLSGYDSYMSEGGIDNSITVELRDGSGNMMQSRNFNVR